MVPKGNSLDHVSKDHKCILWNIYQKIKINLPNIIMEHMRICAINSKSGKLKSIPYSRMIYAMLQWIPLIRTLKTIGEPSKEELLGLFFFTSLQYQHCDKGEVRKFKGKHYPSLPNGSKDTHFTMETTMLQSLKRITRKLFRLTFRWLWLIKISMALISLSICQRLILYMLGKGRG